MATIDDVQSPADGERRGLPIGAHQSILPHHISGASFLEVGNDTKETPA